MSTDNILLESDEIQDDLLNSDVYFIASLIPSAISENNLDKFIHLTRRNQIGFSIHTDEKFVIIDKLWTPAKKSFPVVKNFLTELSDILLFYNHENLIIQMIGLLAIGGQVFKLTLYKEFAPLISIESIDQTKKIAKKQPDYFEQEELHDPVMDLIFG